MGNISWYRCGLLLFFFISTISCVTSLQITSHSPSLHVGDDTRKLVSTTISNVKTQSIPLEKVDYRTPYGGRKMKSYAVVKKGMAQRASREEDGDKLVRTSSSIQDQNHVNPQEEDDMKRDLKYEAISKQETMADERISARKQQFKTTDMDSFVSYADYPAPHHHPPKNN